METFLQITPGECLGVMFAIFAIALAAMLTARDNNNLPPPAL